MSTKYTHNRLFLANPQKIGIGEIYNPKEVELTLKFNGLNELYFEVYEKENGESTEFYNQILSNKLIELQYIGWFQIDSANPIQDDKMQCEKKEVKCYSLENELVDKNIDYINDVYALYDPYDTNYSILHKIVENTDWNIGHISNSLMSKYRTFDIDNARKHSFLTQDVSKSFDCVFLFDTFEKTINAYKLDEAGELTDVIIHASNILKSYEQSSSRVVTKLRVMGGDGFDIRTVNPPATNELINIDYFLVPISLGGWMTDGLVTAFNNYKTAYNNAQSNYTTKHNLYKTKVAELTTLKSQLVTLEGQKEAQEEVRGSYIELYDNKTPTTGTTDYTNYINAINSISTYVTQITNKKTEITTKETEVNTLRVQLDDIGTSLNMSNYLTQAQMKELTTFLTEGETYQDSTFVASDTMTDEEIIDMQLELKDNASKELIRASHPQITTTTTISNLFTMRDNMDSLITMEEWREKFDIGNLISLKFRTDYFSTVRIIQMKIKFDDLENIDVTFSDKNRLDDELIQLEEVIANADKAYSTLSLAKYGYDKAASISNEVRNFINGTLDATNNAIQNNANQEMYLDTYGLHMRRWLESQKKYHDCQSLLTNNVLLFTSDNWKTIKTGIGQFTTTSGDKVQAVFADVICGQLIMSENLYVTNASGSYTMNKDGFVATSGIYSVGINPSTPANIIYVSVNGDKKLYVDTTNNRLVLKGHIEATSGTFSGQITGGSMNINNNFIVDANGNLTAKGANFTGTIVGSTFTGGNINGAVITSVGTSSTTVISGGALQITSNNFTTSLGGSGIMLEDGTNFAILNVALFRTNGTIEASIGNITSLTASSMSCPTINNAVPVTYGTYGNFNSLLSTATVGNATKATRATNADYADNAGIASFATNAQYLAYTVYVSANDNFRPIQSGMSSCGTSDGMWTSVWATTSSIQPSDIRIKNSIEQLDDRYIEFFDLLVPKRFKLNDGTSDRYHMGFISQEVEESLIQTGIDSKEFAGFVKEPVYSKKLDNGEYDTDSEIVDYKYFLRYEEFAPIYVTKIKQQDLIIKELQLSVEYLKNQLSRINQ